MGRPSLFVRLAAGLGLALLAACSGPLRADRTRDPFPDTLEDQPAGRRTRGAAGMARYHAHREPAWFDAEIAAATGEFEAGRYREALERTYVALHHNPEPGQQAQLVELLQRINRQVLELKTLDATVVAGKDPIVFGDAIEIRVVFANRGQRRIVVPARRRGSSRSVLVFDVVRIDYDTRANIVTTRQRVLRELESDLELDPGDTRELDFELGLAGNDRPLGGFRTYTIGGMLRPAWIEVEGVRRWEAVALTAAMLRSFRPNYEHLADDPVRRIRQAIGKDAPVHLLTAAALVPAERRRDAVDLLVEQVRGDRAIDWAMFGALQHLCGVELGHDAQAWKAWWPRVRDHYFAPPLPPRDPGVPVFGG